MDEKNPPAAFSFLGAIWGNSWVKLVVSLLSLALAVYFFFLLWGIIKLFIIALVLAYLFDPLVDRIERLGIPRTGAVMLLVAGIIIIVGGVVALLIPSLSKSFDQFLSGLPGYREKITLWAVPFLQEKLGISVPQTWEGWMDQMGRYQGVIRKIAEAAYAPLLDTLSQTFSGLQGLVTTLLSFIVVPVAWFYLLRDIDSFKAGALDLFPPRRRDLVRRYALEVDEIVSNFMRGQLTVCLVLGVIYSIGLQFVADVPLGILIGLLAGLVSVVPYLGVILGIGPALLLALLEHGDILHPGLVILVFAVAQALEGNVITPKIIGDKLGMHPVTIIFAILIWGSLLGLTGMLIAVPVTAIFCVFGKKALQKYKKSPFFISGDSKAGGNS